MSADAAHDSGRVSLIGIDSARCRSGGRNAQDRIVKTAITTAGMSGRSRANRCETNADEYQRSGARELPRAQDVLEVLRIAEMCQHRVQVLGENRTRMQLIDSGDEWQKDPHRSRSVFERHNQRKPPVSDHAEPIRSAEDC
jgi:hypothetical protein